MVTKPQRYNDESRLAAISSTSLILYLTSPAYCVLLVHAYTVGRGIGYFSRATKIFDSSRLGHIASEPSRSGRKIPLYASGKAIGPMFASMGVFSVESYNAGHFPRVFMQTWGLAQMQIALEWPPSPLLCINADSSYTPHHSIVICILRQHRRRH